MSLFLATIASAFATAVDLAIWGTAHSKNGALYLKRFRETHRRNSILARRRLFLSRAQATRTKTRRGEPTTSKRTRSTASPDIFRRFRYGTARHLRPRRCAAKTSAYSFSRRITHARFNINVRASASIGEARTSTGRGKGDAPRSIGRARPSIAETRPTTGEVGN